MKDNLLSQNPSKSSGLRRRRPRANSGDGNGDNRPETPGMIPATPDYGEQVQGGAYRGREEEREEVGGEEEGGGEEEKKDDAVSVVCQTAVPPPPFFLSARSFPMPSTLLDQGLTVIELLPLPPLPLPRVLATFSSYVLYALIPLNLLVAVSLLSLFLFKQALASLSAFVARSPGIRRGEGHRYQEVLRVEVLGAYVREMVGPFLPTVQVSFPFVPYISLDLFVLLLLCCFFVFVFFVFRVLLILLNLSSNLLAYHPSLF